MTIGELYPGEFEAMERQGWLDAVMLEQETMNMDGLYKLLSDPRVTLYTESGKTHTGSKELANRVKESEQEPCDDAISRRAVLKLFATHDGKYLFEAIRDLPSVQPIRPRGIWMETVSGRGKCSECGYSHRLVIPKNFCPNCGARMESEEQA